MPLTAPIVRSRRDLCIRRAQTQRRHHFRLSRTHKLLRLAAEPSWTCNLVTLPRSFSVGLHGALALGSVATALGSASCSSGFSDRAGASSRRSQIRLQQRGTHPSEPIWICNLMSPVSLRCLTWVVETLCLESLVFYCPTLARKAQPTESTV